MKFRSLIVALGISVLVLGGALCYWIKWNHFDPFSPTLERGQVVPSADYRFSGPHTHANLTVFLIHGAATLTGKTYLTLQEALEQNKVVVHETGNVSSLAIENRSGEEVFIQSGDIVKGGQQDRTFPYDFIAPPYSGKLAIDSFCVEAGRWQARHGDVSSMHFASSSNALSSNSLKLAATDYKSQPEVWRNVAGVQARLSAKLRANVQSVDSPSSLQLSLENSSLQAAIAPYLTQLKPLLEDKSDVIGYAVAINGKILSADVYASGSLFRKLWPKLLESSAIEAFSELDEGKKVETVSVDALKHLLAQAEQGQPADEAVTARVYVVKRESDKHVLFDTCDRAQRNLVVHRSFLAR